MLTACPSIKTLPTAPPDLQAKLDELQKTIDCMTETAKEASNRAIDEHNLITKYRDALHEINNKCRGSTTNYGVARAIACNALGIKHTDSKQPPSSELDIQEKLTKAIDALLKLRKITSDLHSDEGEKSLMNRCLDVRHIVEQTLKELS